MIGLAGLSDPAVEYRLDMAVPSLQGVMEQQLAARAGSVALRWPGRILRAGDGTNIKLYASKGTDWRVNGVFDLGSSGFSHLALTDERKAESADRGAPVPGEVRIMDRNYVRTPALRRSARTVPISPTPSSACAGRRSA